MDPSAVKTLPDKVKIPFYRVLYVQVLFAIIVGGLLGWKFPVIATNDWVKAMGDGFIKLIKMVIAPIIFCTVVSGIAHVQGAKTVGRIGVKAMIYFEIVSTFSLIIGVVIANLLHPGANFGGKAPDASVVASFAKQAHEMKSVDFVLNIIPESAVGGFAKGDILQVLLFSILFGLALMALGEKTKALRSIIDELAQAVFGVIGLVMKAAPFGAFGAMAYTVGKYGPQALGNLLGLIATFYLTSALFVIVVLGLVARFIGFNIFKYLNYIKDELLIVLGTSSSESALPNLMRKMEAMGCSKPVVGLVVPTGYSFNLDGTNIYMSLATIFIAQALGFHLGLKDQLAIILVAMLTSKGASGVSGAGFVTLAATLSVVSPALVPGMAIVLGIDKFMSECRALTNITGNGIACAFVSWWEGELNRHKLHAIIGGRDFTVEDGAKTEVNAEG
ncbi:MAG: C4-dicarboxylate transporter DctA [Holophaga sp.]|nr:C4-dicarboxylate transporter DctA [Holophaga sp.]